MLKPEAIRREKLLIINNDAGIRQQMVDCLSKAGYHVDCSDEVELSTLEVSNPDLLMVDLARSDEGRLDFIAEVIDFNPELPILVMAEIDTEELTVTALEMGITDYLLMLKPLSMKRLLFFVASNLKRAAMANENRKYRAKLEATNIELKASLKEIQMDQQAGRLVQQKMLPENPYSLLGCRFEHLILPANYLSGDFVDYHQISREKLVFFLLDVTGHGASSAFVTVLIKQLATRSRKHFVEDQHHKVHSAAWILNWMNQSLLDINIDRHLTIFIGVINSETRSLNYSYGGHFPKAVFTSNRKSRFLKGKGLPVGLFDHAQYENHYLELPEEYGITLFSDGILEVMPHDTLAEKEEYLLKTVCEQNSIEHITKQFKLKDVDHAPDDISILTVNARGSHEHR